MTGQLNVTDCMSPGVEDWDEHDLSQSCFLKVFRLVPAYSITIVISG